MRFTSKLLLIVLLVVFSCSIACADAPPAEVSFQADIVYGRVGEEELKLNLAMPKTINGKLPCIVVIHGGAWRWGKRVHHDDEVRQFARQGYVAATISYRYLPKHKFPAQVQDAKCAVRFLRANAEKFHIDPDRIGAVGFSAGAHLAMLLGVMDPPDGLDDSGGSDGFSSKVQAVVSCMGPTDFTMKLPDESRPLFEAFIGGTIEQKRDEYVRASPITYLNKGDPPILLLQGLADTIVPYEQAIRMGEAMQKAGVLGRVELISQAEHGWKGWEVQRTMATTISFFDQYLKATPVKS